MRINPVNTISFKRNINIIDAHTHDKPLEKMGSNASSFDVLKFMNKPFESNGDTFTVKKMFPSSLDACFYDELTGKPYLDESKGNEAVLKTFENTDVKEFLAVCQPKDGSVENIEKLFKNHPNKFIGLKFHPEGLKLEADSALYDPYLEFAKEHKIPCLFHSYNSKFYEHPKEHWTLDKSLYSRPEQIYTLAKRHPDVPFIMAHCGGTGDINVEEAVNTIITSAKKGDAKLYADLSWVSIDVKEDEPFMGDLINAIKKLKNSEAGDLTDRIMFGTDAPIDRFSKENAVESYRGYIKNIHKAIKENFGTDADDIADKIFFKNAKKVYFNKSLKQSKTLVGLAFLGIGALVGAGIYIVKNKDNICKNLKEIKLF